MKAPHVASLLRVAVPGVLAASSALVWNGVASPRTSVQAAPPIQFGTPTVVEITTQIAQFPTLQEMAAQMSAAAAPSS